MTVGRRGSKICSWVTTVLLVYGCTISEAKVADIDKPIPVEEATVVAGSPARLECDLRPSKPEDSAYLVLWYLESQKQPIYSVDLRARSVHQAKHWADERLVNRSEFVTFDPAALLFYNVSESDSGIYRCRVDFRHSPTRHIKYRLNVIQPPKVPVIYDNSAREFRSVAGPYDEGSDLTLNCEFFGGGSRVRLGWYRNNREISARVEHLNQGVMVNHLLLRDLDRTHHGATYTCTATLENVPSIAPVSKSVTLQIRLKPSLVEIIPPTPAVLESGKSEEIQCKAVGANPAAFITWWAGNRQLHNALTLWSNEDNGTLSTLTVIASTEDDGRILTCRAQTPQLLGGAVEDSWRMQVYYPPKVSLGLGPPLTGDEIREGSDIYLECHVRANPPVQKLTWILNGRVLEENRNAGILFANQTLVLRRVGRQHAGNYSCVAANRQGEATSSVLPINVKYAPVCRRTTNRAVYVSIGQTATLRCQVDADPQDVTFSWALASGRQTTLVAREARNDQGLTSILEHMPRRDADFGQLQCWAMNSIGKQKESCNFDIIKEGLPSPPSDCTLHILADGHLEVSCKNDGISDIDGDDDVTLSASPSHHFRLELYESDTGRLLRNVSSKEARFTVADVDPSTRVAAVIWGCNLNGRSEAVTLEGAVERAVGSRAASDPDPTLSTALLLAVPGVLLIVVVVMAAIVAFYQRKRKRNGRSQSVQQTATEILDPNSGQPDLIKAKHAAEQLHAENSPTKCSLGNSLSTQDEVFPTVTKVSLRLQKNSSAVNQYLV